MKNLGIAYLIDFYGNLLSDKQRDIMQMYYQEDMSLAEISSELGITRQGVRDNIIRAEKELVNFENSLGLCKKFSSISENLSLIRERLSPDKVVSKEDYAYIINLIDSVENNI